MSSGLDNVLGDDEDDDEGVMSFEALYSNLVLNSEIVVTVAAEHVPNLKTGIKNVKNRQATKNRSEGLAPVAGVLIFDERKSDSVQGAIDVTITLSQKGAIKVIGMRIPDGHF